MAIFVNIILLTLWIQVTIPFTKYPAVINRLNFGLTFELGPQLDIVSGRWLHLYLLKLPDFPRKVPLNVTHVCPQKEYIGTDNPQGRFRMNSLNTCLHKHVTQPEDIPSCPAVQKPLHLSPLRNYHVCIDSYVETGKLPPRCNFPTIMPIFNNVKRAKNLCDKSRQIYQAYEDIHQQYFDKYLKDTHKTFLLLKDITRPRRAFIDISQPLSSLFGTARQSDIDQMKTTIDQISTRQEASLRMASKAYKHTFQLAKTVKENLDNTDKMIQDLHSEVLALLGEEEKLIEQNFQLMFQWTKTLQKFLTLYLSVDSQVTTILTSIKHLLQGKISPELIPEQEVKGAITHIHSTLNEHHPSYTTPIHTPQDFYRHTEFYVHLVDTKVYIGVFLPISHVNNRYQLYTIRQHPYPLGFKSDKMAQLQDYHNMIATSLNRQYYFYVDQQDLQLHCLRNDRYTCFYNPTIIHSSQPTCEHAIMMNEVAHVTDICEHHIIHKPLTPNVYRFDHSSYILANISQYQINCGTKFETKNGCFYCLLKLSCDCTIVVGTKEIQSLFDTCHHPNTTSVVTYPVNVMVAKYLKPTTEFSKLLGHQMQTEEDTSSAPKLNIYENAYSRDLAASKFDQVQLRKVMENLKDDNISFKSAIDKIVHSHPVFQPSSSKSFLQNMTDKAIHITQFAWLAIITTAIIYILCCLHIMTAPLMLARPTTTQAYATDTPTPADNVQTVDIIQSLKDNHHLLSMAIIIFILFWLITKAYKLCIIKHKWEKLKWFLCLCQHTTCNPKFKRIYVNFPSTTQLYFFYLQKLPVHIIPSPYLEQGSFKELQIQTIIPCFYYKVNMIFEKPPILYHLFIYLGFYVAFNTVQVISRRVVGRAEETST